VDCLGKVAGRHVSPLVQCEILKGNNNCHENEWIIFTSIRKMLKYENGKSTYKLHCAAPLSITEVPKCHPILKSTTTSFGSSAGGNPPCTNYVVLCFSLFLGLRVLLNFAEGNVLLLEIRKNVLCSSPLKTLSPMEQTSTFFIFHGLVFVATAINSQNGMPICTSAVGHEALKVCLL